jgi:UDP-N-acetylmuramate--alanine ligase
MVAEADESDRSFLKLYPSIAVMTNVDREHMEAYGSFEDLVQAFVEFANKVPFYGSVIACGDDAELMRLRPRLTRRVVTYGLTSEHVDLTAVDVQLAGFGSSCTVIRRHPLDGTSQALGPMRLQVPGRHSVQNALAAVAVGLELEVPFTHIATGLAGFQGAERRFQHHGTIHEVQVVDDYGHHPTEIAAVLAAARAARPSRVVVAFQPHRYTRTRDLMREFGLALAGADEVMLTDIYSASEEPLPGVTVEALAASINTSRATPARIVNSVDDVAAALAEIARPGDLVITMGAGSIGTVATRLVAELERRHGRKEAT